MNKFYVHDIMTRYNRYLVEDAIKDWVLSMRQILLADYDRAMYEAIIQALQEIYKVSPLPSVTDLKEYLIQNKVDLVLLTVSDEYTDSFDIYEQMKTIPEMTGKPVIFLAEHGNTWIEEKILSIDVQDFVTLPATPAMLRVKLENCLELHTLRSNKQYVEKYQDAIAFSIAELVDFRDETTGGHLKNTTKYFGILLEEAMANDYYKDIIELEDIRDLLRSAALHDIGKIGINDDILRKVSSLDYHEYEFMKTHTTLGMQAFDRIIRETGGTRWLYLAKDIAYCHHEYWDGSGYPNGLKGEEIPIYARIMAIVDVYDALTSARSYKDAYTHQRALEIITAEKGSTFDPRLVELFMSAQGRFEEMLLQKNSN
jgi:putative two-component system response regulator